MTTTTAARGRGVSHLALKTESTFGVQPAGNFTALPFYTSTLEMRKSHEDDPVLGAAQANQRDATAFTEGLPTTAGELTVPVGVESFGHYLTYLFGAPVTGAAEDVGGTDHFTHVWQSGADILPTAHIEIARRTGAFHVFSGVVFNTLALTLDKQSGTLRATLGALGKREFAPAANSIAGTVARLAADTLISRKRGSFKLNDVAAQKVLTCGLNYNNAIDAPPFLTGDEYPAEFMAGAATAQGTLRARYYDDTWQAIGRARTVSKFTQRWGVSDDIWLETEMPACEIETRGAPVNGAGFEDLDFAFMAKQTDAAGAVKISLRNTVAAYV